MGYRSGGRREHLTSNDALENIDRKLGFTKGTLYDLCLASIESKTKTKKEVKVTYRGEIDHQIRMTHRLAQVRKAVFLIEFKITKAGKLVDRVVQVHLEV
ncbi:MAG: hypothetical protein O7B30_03225 [Thaumarchaeota archaeon]|nr:hypothetical protein [Nitrososphaerota archaeon]